MKTNYEHYKRDIAETIVQYGYLVFKHREVPKGIYFKPTETNIKDVIKWFEEEYKEPIQMTSFERSILECAVNHGYEWIARDDRRNWLCIYKEKPRKGDSEWHSTDEEWGVGREYLCLELFSDKFQFVKWTDEEPTYIPTLLKECEVVEND